MLYVFEIYFKAPANPAKVATVASRVTALGGRFDFREEATEHSGAGGIRSVTTTEIDGGTGR